MIQIQRLGKKKAQKYFFGILALFAAILVWFLFFSPGLTLVGQQSGNDARLFVANNGQHVIQNIRITTADGNELLLIAHLQPREQVEIPLQGLKGETIIFARAPFHAEARKTLSLSGLQGVKLDYESATPDNGVIGFAIPLQVSVCNRGRSDVTEVSLAESHDPDFFGNENNTQSFGLQAGTCKVTRFILMPAKTGRTQIYFNINALDLNDSFAREIIIREQ